MGLFAGLLALDFPKGNLESSRHDARNIGIIFKQVLALLHTQDLTRMLYMLVPTHLFVYKKGGMGNSAEVWRSTYNMQAGSFDCRAGLQRFGAVQFM